jgi:hypothetical protein
MTESDTIGTSDTYLVCASLVQIVFDSVLILKDQSSMDSSSIAFHVVDVEGIAI